MRNPLQFLTRKSTQDILPEGSVQITLHLDRHDRQCDTIYYVWSKEAEKFKKRKNEETTFLSFTDIYEREIDVLYGDIDRISIKETNYPFAQLEVIP